MNTCFTLTKFFSQTCSHNSIKQRYTSTFKQEYFAVYKTNDF